MTRRRLFALLDHIAAGLEREAAMPEDERAAKAAQIRAWFEPLARAIQAAEAEHPCAAGGGRLVLAVASGEILEDTRPAACACEDCFRQALDAWKRARGRSSLWPSAMPAPPIAPAQDALSAAR